MSDEKGKTVKHNLKRRNFDLGTVDYDSSNTIDDTLANWHEGNPVLLKGACSSLIAQHSDNIEHAFSLYQTVLEGNECDPVLAGPPYNKRLDQQSGYSYESLGCSVNEGDDQEIETILFDAIKEDKLVAEDLWMKISWLSFNEEDASLRFRFSFGVDNLEDVSADKPRQRHAGNLADAVFPESTIITENNALVKILKKLVANNNLEFVERIVYFNAPNGGAYMHHDREHGHAGVVYAQITGASFWLALAKDKLVEEIALFVKQCGATSTWPGTVNSEMQNELKGLAKDKKKLAAELDSFSNDTLTHLINETEAFVQRLINNGHSRVVQTGDVMLLPQETDSNCCWHSVFCLGEEPGEALSFAIRDA